MSRRSQLTLQQEALIMSWWFGFTPLTYEIEKLLRWLYS